MLDNLQFANAVEIMTKAFPMPSIEKRISSLYYFFKKESFATIKAASEQSAYELEKFPTPAQFAFRVKQHRPKGAAQAIPCDFCGATGLLTAYRRNDRSTFTFRCHCANAAVYEKIPAWTKECKTHFEVVYINPFQDLQANPEIYEKGLNYMKAQGIFMPPEIRAKIQERIARAKNMKLQSRDPGEEG